MMMKTRTSGEISIPPKIWHAPANRPQRRLGDAVEEIRHHADELVARVDHVEGDQPRKDGRCDQQIDIELKGKIDDQEQGAHLGKSLVGKRLPHVAGLPGANKPGAKRACVRNCDCLAPALSTCLIDLAGGPALNGRYPPTGAARCRSGAVAQLGERLVRNEEVRGSIPLGSTILHIAALGKPGFPAWTADRRLPPGITGYISKFHQHSRCLVFRRSLRRG